MKEREPIISQEDDQTSEGLNQIFEIINAKGDAGELNEIVQTPDEHLLCSDDLFDRQLFAIVDDTVREDEE
ncbi:MULTISPECIES: hypothetical protein [Metabacillus]|uniref:Uncharacterized protein n=1 Tax=Metabacillus hrfriensis TaxID=3048891 RepID=A0ACD4RIP4_9BACI|nr:MULTISPECIES: hypothetical protein [Metabacillus]UAL54906.1 hypothetical protein K8L98_20460 [Metabacillus dongyingensis]UOK60028.1 hypothetical protein MGI18_23510 [Bacillus sp. OVS6]USK31161.1 hypothetical protein LIT32_20620 [Bacillus sp. CMF21]WHZ60380.1 hypothetical protein QLQ22_20615 [Metabacillus sp. CT-WN-B3]